MKLESIYAHQFNTVFSLALSWTVSCSILFMVLGSHASAHCSEVANFTACCACLYICQVLYQHMAATTIFTCLFCRHLCLHVSSRIALVCIFVTFILSNSFA